MKNILVTRLSCGQVERMELLSSASTVLDVQKGAIYELVDAEDVPGLWMRIRLQGKALVLELNNQAVMTLRGFSESPSP